MSDFFYSPPIHGWTCFHCGETMQTPRAAQLHFGKHPASVPACVIKQGAEMSLVKGYRMLEDENERLLRQLHEEHIQYLSSWATSEQLRRGMTQAAEELGYERGLSDGRRESIQRQIMIVNGLGGEARISRKVVINSQKLSLLQTEDPRTGEIILKTTEK